MKHRSITMAVAVAFAVVALAPTVAFADAKTVKKIKQKNREAMENYDLLDYEAAKKGLNEALALAKRKRMSKHKVVAETHLYLGIVEFSGFEDQESAILQFMDAVVIDPAVEVPAAYRTPELTDLLETAKSEVGGGGGAPAPTGGGDSVDCSSLMGMQHELVDEASGGSEKSVDAYVAPDVGHKSVSLFYRPPGDTAFTEVKMKKSGECKYVGVIPGDAIRGDFVHYYVAAQKGGKVLASKGSAGSPNIIDVISGGGGGTSGAGGGGFDEENPLAGGSKKKRASSDTNGTVGDSVTVGPKKSSFFLSLALGSGGGYVTGETESTSNAVGCCFAPALFHVFPELGFFMNNKTSLSVAFRVGFPIGANIQGHSTGAPSAMLRIRHAMSDDGTGLTLNGGVGGGVIRNTVKLSEPANGDPAMDTDTTAQGPVLVGLGAGYTSALGGPMRFLFEVNAIAGIPVVEEFGGVKPNFGVQVDVNLGLQFAF